MKHVNVTYIVYLHPEGPALTSGQLEVLTVELGDFQMERLSEGAFRLLTAAEEKIVWALDAVYIVRHETSSKGPVRLSENVAPAVKIWRG